jgi:2-polyprenyl-3-methyl-5-hydroxy-6-metoxy-1,4-benzoquinol methylase
MQKVINKSMDMNDLMTPEGKAFIKDLTDFINFTIKKNINISSWYGNINGNEFYRKLSMLNRGYDYIPILDEKLDVKFPNYLLWEIYWVYKNIDFMKGKTLLDIGGACSLFSFYLASKGVKVTAIDLKEDLAEEANKIGKQLKYDYTGVCADVEEYLLNNETKYDYITSICVFEHIEINKRKRIVSLIAKRLKDDGRVGFTFDYRNPSKFVQIDTPKDVLDQLSNKDLFEIVGNKDFYDNHIDYLIHPFYRKPIFWKYKFRSIKKGNFPITELFKTKKNNDYTFGALFLKKANTKKRNSR